MLKKAPLHLNIPAREACPTFGANICNSPEKQTDEDIPVTVIEKAIELILNFPPPMPPPMPPPEENIAFDTFRKNYMKKFGKKKRESRKQVKKVRIKLADIQGNKVDRDSSSTTKTKKDEKYDKWGTFRKNYHQKYIQKQKEAAAKQ